MLKRLLFWGLLPFVIPQALKVRRTAPRFAGATGDNFGSVGDGETLPLLAIGDSIIAGVGASTFDKALVGRTSEALAQHTGKRVEWQAMGQIGATSEKVAKRLTRRVKKEGYKVIVVSVGVNDVTSLRRTKGWENSLSELLDKLHVHSSSAVIAVVGIPPLWGFPLLPAPLKYVLGIRAKTFDSAMKDVVHQRSYAVHVPLEFEPEKSKFSEDGYHPSEESYKEFGEAVALGILSHHEFEQVVDGI